MDTVLIDLSKAYDCIPYDLLITKLAAYGLENSSPIFIFIYQTEELRFRINNSLSDYVTIFLRVSQCSILGSLNGLILFPQKSDLCNLVDDNNLYTFSKCIDLLNIYPKERYSRYSTLA